MGELDFPTPPNIVEACARALRDGKTKYTPNGGLPELRDALAEDVGRARSTHYARENVAIQPAGKPVIGKFLLALMDPGDEVLYPNPGFPIYSSLIGFFGGVAVPYTYIEGPERFRLDLEGIERQITPKTRLLILNDMHNPTAAECTPAELRRLSELVLEHNLFVLSDEAYFDVRYEGTSHSLVSLPGMAERCVILYTFGKKYAMTGFRLGAAIGPRPLIDIIVRLNVNWESCPNHFAQYGALEALTGGGDGTAEILAQLRERRDAAVEILRRDAGGTLPQARDDLLPLPERYGGGEDGRVPRSRGLSPPGPRADGRVVLHAAALRDAAARGVAVLPRYRSRCIINRLCMENTECREKKESKR